MATHNSFNKHLLLGLDSILGLSAAILLCRLVTWLFNHHSGLLPLTRAAQISGYSLLIGLMLRAKIIKNERIRAGQVINKAVDHTVNALFYVFIAIMVISVIIFTLVGLAWRS